MGITKDRFYFFKKLNSFDFILSQSFWGCKKDKVNSIYNSYILSVKNDFFIIKTDICLDYLSRLTLFCSNVISKRGSIFFFIPLACKDIVKNSMRELAFFFSLRSIQPFCLESETNALFKKKRKTVSFKKHAYLIVLPSNKDFDFLIKKMLTNLVPFVCIEDIDSKLHKGLYSIIGNKDSIYYIFFYYKVLSNLILKSMLLSYCKYMIEN